MICCNRSSRVFQRVEIELGGLPVCDVNSSGTWRIPVPSLSVSACWPGWIIVPVRAMSCAALWSGGVNMRICSGADSTGSWGIVVPAVSGAALRSSGIVVPVSSMSWTTRSAWGIVRPGFACAGSNAEH